MTLPVPLTVRVGERLLTHELAALQFREEAIGGVKSLNFRLARPLNRFDPDLAELSKVYISDGRSAEPIAEGRLTDFGRSAGADGQQWDIVAFGPGQAASDQAFPYAMVSQSLEPFRRSSVATKNATVGNDERGDDDPSILLSAEQGKTVSTSWQADSINRLMYWAGMKIARIRCQIDAGVTDANYVQQLVTKTGGGAGNVADTASASTTAGTLSAVVVTDFPNGDNVVSFRTVRNTSSTTGAESHWFEFWDLSLRALLLDAEGAEITTGYTTNTVLAHQVVNDLLGRVLDQFDGATAIVDTSAAYTIDQMAYPDGVTAEQVLDDLMALEPSLRWTTGPTTSAGTWQFRWELWPTTVRYEVTLDDGGNFPASTNELYNEVTVRWNDKDGRPRTTTRTLACPILDDAGITRSFIVDAADEIGSSAAATRLGDNFLAEHNVPANAGSLTISRPIRDLVLGRMVQPWEIKAGELIRVRGVESYTDPLNADDNDGQTVFRIWSKTYDSDSNSAALELDTYSRTEANALRKVLKRRQRRR